jgi:hypothetical protein
MLFEMMNDRRSEPVISDEEIAATQNEAIVFGDRLEHVVQIRPKRKALSSRIYAICANIGIRLGLLLSV